MTTDKLGEFVTERLRLFDAKAALEAGVPGIVKQRLSPMVTVVSSADHVTVYFDMVRRCKAGDACAFEQPGVGWCQHVKADFAILPAEVFGKPVDHLDLLIRDRATACVHAIANLGGEVLPDPYGRQPPALADGSGGVEKLADEPEIVHG